MRSVRVPDADQAKVHRTRLAAIALCGGVALPGAYAASGCATTTEEPNPVVPGDPTNQLPSSGTGSSLSGGSGGFQPVFGPTVTATVAPPPISGGTLLTTRDGARVVLSDPDRDAVYIVNIAATQPFVEHAVQLQAGDEPGRLVEDGAGTVHVALRRGGALVDIDVTRGLVLGRRAACPAPRGAAWDAATDLVWVACATGELVALPAAGGAVSHTVALERDLRDVIVTQGQIAVTKFRSAEVLRLAGDGTVLRRDALSSPSPGAVSHVAWRAVPGPAGALVTVHQAESTASLQTHVQGGYGSGEGFCSGGLTPGGFIGGTSMASGPGFGNVGGSFGFGSSPGFAGEDAGSLAFVTDDAAGDDASPAPSGVDGSGPLILPNTPAPAPQPQAAVQCLGGDTGTVWNGLTQNNRGGPLLSPCGSSVVQSVMTVLASNGSPLLNVAFSGVLPVDVAVSGDGSAIAAVTPGNSFTALDNIFVFNGCGTLSTSGPVDVNSATQVPIAVGFDGSNDLLVQTREPAELYIYRRTAPEATPAAPTTVRLSTDDSREDTGHDVFHVQAGGMIACASCHPEGGDDGNVWILDGSRRRTPSLKGTIAGTAPYHWPGDQPNLVALVNDVYTIRMSGAQLPNDEMQALTGWVQTVPPPAAPKSAAPDAVARGDALFHRTDVGCATCHSGPKFTNNATVDVGTGGAFQVPPLVGVGWRTPLMHDGCATTLADRFGRCATAQHGSTGSLSPSDVSDLIAYLETL